MAKDWYERRSELKPGMVFCTFDATIVRLDVRTAGDGTDWDCDVWYAGRPDVPGYETGHWSAEMFGIHPSDLAERLPDNFGDPA